MIHLHVHSHYSTLDGLSKVTDIVERAAELNAPAVAITDHGSISCLPEFLKEAETAGIKPIIGCEFYGVDTLDEHERKKQKRYHFNVWAKTWNGVESIMKQLTLANAQFYRRPVLTWEQTLDFKDCMIGTACAFGVLSHDEFGEIAGSMNRTYGQDFYLELMPHEVIIGGVDIQKRVNERALTLHKMKGTKILATNDSHYTRAEDAEAHNVLMAIQYQKKIEEYEGWPGVFFMRSIKEMAAAFTELGYFDQGDIKTALLTTGELASKVAIVKPEYEMSLPQVYDDDDHYARKRILDGWSEKIKRKVQGNAAQYHKRLIYELGIIKKMGFMNYFLMVEDVIRWARSQGIMVGPARGSAAGSLVCYLMDITQVDPIKHGLYFERFLNPDRIEMPDIDIDFADNRRSEVVTYVSGKYGREYVGQIGTFGYLTVKSGFRDVCRTYGISNIRVNALSRQIEDEDSFDKVPELLAFARQNPDIVRLSKKLSGTIRNTGVHACLAGESKLLTADGYKRIDSLDGATVSLLTKVGMKKAKVFCNGVKDIYRLKYAKSKYSSNKHELLVTRDHLVGSVDGFVEAGESIGRDVGVAWHECDDTLPVFAGWFWDDGHYYETAGASGPLPGGMLYLTPGKEDEAETLFRNAGYLAGQQKDRPDKHRIKRAVVSEIIGRFGDGCKRRNSDGLPPVFNSKSDMILWLRGFLSANATVQRGTIRLKLTSFTTIRYVRDMLAELGINGCKIQRVEGRKIAFRNGDYLCRDSYKIEISRNGTFLYGHLIGFIQSYKQDRIDRRVYYDMEYLRTDKVYDFSVLSESEQDRNGYVDGVLVHNCGLLISSRPLREVTVMERRKGGTFASSWDMRQMESFGLLKIDALGLTTLSVLEHSLQLVKENVGVDIDFTALPLDDPKTLEAFSRGECACIFQFEGSRMQQLLRDLKAGDFETITATTALYRPGPLNSGLTATYVKISQGVEQESYGHDLLEPILKETRSVLVYQEQIMRIFNELGGFSWAQADMMRKIIGKKLGKDEFDKHRERFMKGCQRNGVTDYVAATLFDQMAEFASYAFNRSHAVSYTLLSYWSMYMKAHYSAEYLTGRLSWVDKEERIIEAINEAKRLNVPVSRPDINLSTGRYELADGEVIAPLSAVKGVGTKAVEAILKARGEDVFLSVDDLKEKLKEMKLARTAHKGIIEKLERAGVFESIGIREPDAEQRRKNYSELLPMFNDMPSMSAKRDRIDLAGLAHIYRAINDHAKLKAKAPIYPQTGTYPVIMAINMPVKKEEKLLTNRGTKLFTDTLRGLGITKRNIYYTSVIKELVPAPSQAPKSSISFGLGVIKEEIKAVRPKLIICFAAQAIPLFIPDGKMGKLQGRVVYSKEFDCYAIFSYSPQYQLYQGEKAGNSFFDNMTKVRSMFEEDH